LARDSTSPPGFVRGNPLLEQAFGLAREAHHGPRRQGDTDIGHPAAVAELLHSREFEHEIVAAAVLHDVVEDTEVDLPELADRFGSRICELVREMTENSAIGTYGERKAEHRERITRNRPVAAIYCADKLANAREMDEPGEVPADKLEHYQATLEILCDSHPELPFLADLRRELERVRAGR
jgi:(p)ppGpp synthase/HD superfamily hydrolase